MPYIHSITFVLACYYITWLHLSSFRKQIYVGHRQALELSARKIQVEKDWKTKFFQEVLQTEEQQDKMRNKTKHYQWEHNGKEVLSDNVSVGQCEDYEDWTMVGGDDGRCDSDGGVQP